MGGGGDSYAGASNATYSAVFAAAPIDVLCHLGLSIEALAFLQSKVLYIRILEITHAIFMICYSASYSNKFNFADCHFVWGVIIILTNSYKIFTERLRYDNVRRRLTDDDLLLKELVFESLTTLEFAVLKYKWNRQVIPKGEYLLKKDDLVDELILIFRGKAKVETGEGIFIASVGRGNYLGEISFITKEAATASVKATTDCIAVKWPNKTVQHYSKHGHSLEGQAFSKLVLGFQLDMARKIKQNNITRVESVREMGDPRHVVGGGGTDEEGDGGEDGGGDDDEDDDFGSVHNLAELRELRKKSDRKRGKSEIFQNWDEVLGKSNSNSMPIRKVTRIRPAASASTTAGQGETDSGAKRRTSRVAPQPEAQ